MPLIDLQCHVGMTPGAMAARPPELAQASQYADERSVEILCFAAAEAVTDLDGGNAHLAQALETDARFRGWLNLSVHQPDQSLELAKTYLNKSSWVGARFEQHSEDDAVTAAGGMSLINSLRRYGKPILVTANSPATLHAVIEAAAQSNTLKFLLSPQNTNLTTDALPAIRETLNISLLPSAAYVERDVIAQAVATIGERRIYWASDWGRLNPSAALGMLSESVISVPHKVRIGYKNAQELLSTQL